MAQPQQYIYRKAIRDDMDDVVDMIQELANFEKMPDGPQLTATDLIRDGGFDSDTAHPLFVCFVVEVESTDHSQQTRGPVIGYSLCYFKGYDIDGSRVLYMEDVYVRQAYRSGGIGEQLIAFVESYARSQGCCRLEFQVLRWNPAARLYRRIGAVDLTESDGWHQYRVAGDALVALANK